MRAKAHLSTEGQEKLKPDLSAEGQAQALRAEAQDLELKPKTSQLKPKI